MNACGLGKMVPNMVLLGFKNDWMSDYDNVNGYINVLHHALDMHLSLGVLKLKVSNVYFCFILGPIWSFCLIWFMVSFVLFVV